MIAVRLLSREAWEARLQALECRPLDSKGPLNTAEFWITPWEFWFTVPVEGPDDRCGERELAQLIETINDTKP